MDKSIVKKGAIFYASQCSYV